MAPSVPDSGFACSWSSRRTYNCDCASGTLSNKGEHLAVWRQDRRWPVMQLVLPKGYICAQFRAQLLDWL